MKHCALIKLGYRLWSLCEEMWAVLSYEPFFRGMKKLKYPIFHKNKRFNLRKFHSLRKTHLSRICSPFSALLKIFGMVSCSMYLYRCNIWEERMETTNSGCMWFITIDTATDENTFSFFWNFTSEQSRCKICITILSDLERDYRNNEWGTDRERERNAK